MFELGVVKTRNKQDGWDKFKVWKFKVIKPKQNSECTEEIITVGLLIVIVADILHCTVVGISLLRLQYTKLLTKKTLQYLYHSSRSLDSLIK